MAKEAKKILKKFPEMKPPAGYGTQNVTAIAERIIERDYKNSDSQRKLRTFLKHLYAELQQGAETEPIPAHIKDDITANTIYSLNLEEIQAVLLEKSRTMNTPEQDRYSKLLTDAATAKGGFLQYIRAERTRLQTLWDAARFLEFGFEELATKRNWNWLLKIAVHQELKKVHSEYDIRLVLCPEKHYSAIRTLEDEIKELQEAPQTTMLPDEENDKIKSRRDRIAERQAAWAERVKGCPDVVFAGKVKGVDYRDVKIWDEDEGESTTIPGTILTLKIPGRTVEELNAIRGAIEDYHIRLQPV